MKSALPFAESSLPLFAGRNWPRAIGAGWALGVAVGASAAAILADTKISRPYRGVTLISRTEVKPRPLRMNIVRVDLTAPGPGFRLTRPGGPLDSVRQPTAEFPLQEAAQLAVNAHFHVSAATGLDAELVGFAMWEGKLLSSFEPQPVVPGGLDQGYAILPLADREVAPDGTFAVVPAEGLTADDGQKPSRT